MTVKEKEQKIKELHERLDWYYDCSLDEEFDADEVISLLHQLDQLHSSFVPGSVSVTV